MTTTKLHPTQISGPTTWVPTDATGATNMASELEAFITANPGKIVDIASGSTILLENFGTGFATIPTLTHVRAYGVTILHNNASRCVDINNTANASVEYSVSAIADDNTQNGGNLASTKITLTASSSALAHDIVAIYSTDSYDGSSGVDMGEIAQLAMDEQSGNNLYTTGNLSLTSKFTAANTKVRILDKNRKFIWEGGTFKSNGDVDDLTITTRQECIRVIGFVDPKVTAVVFNAPWAQMIWYQCCARGLIDDIKIYDTLNNAAAGGFTYGAYFYGMNWGHVVRDMHVFDGRHPGYTSGSDATPSAWYERGYPTKATLDSIVGYNCYGSLLDTHEEGADHTFINCIAWDSYESRDPGVFRGRLGQSRAVRDVFINCHAFGGVGGITIDNVNHSLTGPNIIRIENCTFSKIQNNGGSARAVDIDDQAAAGRTKLEIHNCRFYDCDDGIEVGDNTVMSYSNLEFYRVDDCVLARDGSVSYGVNMLVNNIGTSYTGLSKVWDIYSTDGDVYVTCLGNNVVIKDGTNLPREWFSEGDGVGNKYVYHGGIEDCKEVDSVTPVSATLSKESGATTFTDLTTVATVAL